jgi:hypothetical protein
MYISCAARGATAEIRVHLVPYLRQEVALIILCLSLEAMYVSAAGPPSSAY